MREINKEISLKMKALAYIRKKISLNRKSAFHLSLENPQDFDSNPFDDEIAELQLQEILCLQEIQFLKRELNSPSFSLSNKVLEAAQ